MSDIKIHIHFYGIKRRKKAQKNTKNSGGGKFLIFRKIKKNFLRPVKSTIFYFIFFTSLINLVTSLFSDMYRLTGSRNSLI